MEIGSLIYNRRKELGLTLEQIGDYVGVSKSTVKKWESGYISNMRRDKIALLAKILRIPPTDLINAETEKKPPLKLPNADEQELLTIYRSVNQEGQDYIMQTARMVGDTERYQKPDIRLKHARSADDHGAEYVEVTPEERKRLDEAPDETQNPDNDL